MNKFDIIYENVNPKVLVITPLLPGHKISKATKKTIKRNTTPLAWISSMGNNNIPTNIEKGMKWYGYSLPYYLPLDNDIILGRNLIDRLVRRLEGQPDHIAFAYASFQYRGFKNFGFPADRFDIHRLLKHNYISSNSLFRTDVAMDIGLVTDEKYKRLLDWAFLLKLFHHGYGGVPCPEASFIAKSEKENMSMWDKKEYEFKRIRVLEDFGRPLVEKYNAMTQDT